MRDFVRTESRREEIPELLHMGFWREHAKEASHEKKERSAIRAIQAEGLADLKK